MSNHRFERLAASGVRSLNPYQPGKPIEELEREYGVSNIIKLASNENPLGPSPKAVEALDAAKGDLALYPDANGFHLKAALAEKHGVDAEQITLGNGSNDVLVLLAETFLSPAQAAVYSEYSFAVYPIATQAVGAHHQVAAAHGADHEMPFGHDLEAMKNAIDERTRLVFVANPNNPTGTWVKAEALEAFVAGVPDDVIVVIDEAYVEYADPGQIAADRWLSRYPNLVVTRTFSKAYGLAGLRVGYALSHPDVADLLNRVRQPFNVNSMAQAGARAALEDRAFIERSRRLNADGLQQLYSGFERLGLSFVRSRGNFVLFDVERPAVEIYEALLRRSVIVRPVAAYGLPRHLRVTVGTREQNEMFLGALEKSLS